MANDFAFEMAASAVRFGAGVTREVGADLAEMGITNVLVITDPILRGLAPVQTVVESLEASRIPFVIYDRVRIEPSDESFRDAIAFARLHPFDAIVAVGGGSTIDTAKAVNLYTTYPPADFLDYVNPPIGKGLPVPHAEGSGGLEWPRHPEPRRSAIFKLPRRWVWTFLARRRPMRASSWPIASRGSCSG